jgi:phage terminase large subunit-like protein
MPTNGLRPTLGPQVCRWIETFLVHGEGDQFGERWKLERWQREIIYRLYEFYPDTLKRVTRRMLLILPRGCGKTELLAAICLAELAGPTAVGAGGRAELRKSPNIPVAAASREQANRLYGAARTMVEEGPLADHLDTFQFEIQRKDGPGRMLRVAAVDGTNEGGLPTATAADEVHEWRTDRQARTHLVLSTALAKRDQGLELNISTPDAGDHGSLIGDLKDYGARVASGEVADPEFLFVWHHASDGYDLDDPDDLRAAIREATPASWLDTERIAARYEVDRIPEHEFRRYHLAQFVRGGERILPAGAWEALSGADPTEPGARVVLGFDGSYARDSTALVGATVEAQPRIWVEGLWERPDRAPADWRVPRDEVDAAVAGAMGRYDVVELAADPSLWPGEIAEWQSRYGDRVVEFPNSRPRMGPACQRFYSAVVEGDLRHDGDLRLARHLSNAVARETAHGPVWSKPDKNSPHKIDGAIAAAIALDRASWHAENATGALDPELVVL